MPPARCWRLLRRLEFPWPWLAAAVFALHPVQVESVAWITERKNMLSGFFYLLAFNVYWTWDQRLQKPENRGRWRWYAAALLFFLMALLSKTVTSTLPAAILLVIWWKRGHIDRRISCGCCRFSYWVWEWGASPVICKRH